MGNLLLVAFGILVIFGFASIIPYALVHSFRHEWEPVLWNPLKVWAKCYRVVVLKKDD